MRAATRRKLPDGPGVSKASPSLKLVQGGRRVPPAEDPFVERELVRRGVEETVRLERARGAVFGRADMESAPYLRKSVLAVLHEKGKIDKEMREAGERYGMHYRLVFDVGRFPSCLEQQTQGVASVVALIDRFGDELFVARDSALLGIPAMVGVCDQVCGMEQPPSVFFARPDRGAAVGTLAHALERLVEHYSSGWTPKTDDFAALGRAEWERMALALNPEMSPEDFDALWERAGMTLRREKHQRRDFKEERRLIASEAKRIWESKDRELPWSRAMGHERMVVVEAARLALGIEE